MKTESNCKNMTNKRYVNIKQLSTYTSIPIKTLYGWTSAGKVPSIKIGRKLLYDLEDVNAFMAGLKRNYNQCEITANKIVGGINGNNI